MSTAPTSSALTQRCSRPWCHHAAVLTSTAILQLWLIGCVLGALVGALAHPAFWRLVRDQAPWIASVVAVILWHVASQLLLNRSLSDGKTIRRPFTFLCAYLIFSTTYVVVRAPPPCVPCSQLCAHPGRMPVEPVACAPSTVGGAQDTDTRSSRQLTVKWLGGLC
jgi:MFS family permease